MGVTPMSPSRTRSPTGRPSSGAPNPRGSPSPPGVSSSTSESRNGTSWNSQRARNTSPRSGPRATGPRATPPDAVAWDTSVAQVKRDLQAMRRLVRDPATDLFARLPHGTGQTVLREALVLADHNAYHLGQLVLIRRLLGAWKTA